MKKYFLMACTVALLTACGGTGNDYADEVIGIYEDYADEVADAEDEKSLSRACEDCRTKLSDASKDFKEDKTQLERDKEDFKDDAFDTDWAITEAEQRYDWAVQKKRIELKEAEKDK